MFLSLYHLILLMTDVVSEADIRDKVWHITRKAITFIGRGLWRSLGNSFMYYFELKWKDFPEHGVIQFGQRSVFATFLKLPQTYLYQRCIRLFIGHWCGGSLKHEHNVDSVIGKKQRVHKDNFVWDISFSFF